MFHTKIKFFQSSHGEIPDPIEAKYTKNYQSVVATPGVFVWRFQQKNCQQRTLRNYCIIPRSGCNLNAKYSTSCNKDINQKPLTFTSFCEYVTHVVDIDGDHKFINQTPTAYLSGSSVTLGFSETEASLTEIELMATTTTFP